MAGQIITNEVNFPGKAVELKAYVAQPPGSGPFPAVIVVQEWWGLNEHIRDIARRLANEGYFTVAPDLYSRQGHQIAADPNAAGRLMQGLRKEDGIEDLLSTIDWINRQKAANRAKIGVVGFCMGGSYAILLPCSTKDIKAAAPFYGEVPSDDKLENLACPIFYAYGENDGWIARRDVDRLSAALKKFHKHGEVKIYAGCSHGFFNDTRKDVYAPKEAKDAWEHALKLFADNLGR
ncbi:MAG: dienelactone hydrolase family protein [Candidatus Binataceae bacterium]